MPFMDLYQRLKKEFYTTVMEAQQAAKKCDPKIQEAIESATTRKEIKEGEKPSVGTLDEMEIILKNLDKKYANSSFKQVNFMKQDPDVQWLYKFEETLKYLTGLPYDKELGLVARLDGRDVRELSQYRNRHVAHEKLDNHGKDAQKAAQKAVQKKKDPKKFMLGDVRTALKYPALDPKNIFSSKEAELAERMARVREAVQLRPGQTADIIDDFEKSVSISKEMMENASQASYLKSDMNQNEKTMNEGEMKPYENAVEVMEFMAGLRTKEQTSETAIRGYRKWLKQVATKLAEKEQVKVSEKKLEKEIDQAINRTAEMGSQVKNPTEIGKLELNFENIDNVLTNIQKSVPEYKEISQEVLENSQINMEVAAPFIKDYFKATANRLLDPIYSAYETNYGGLDRADLLIVGGKPVREYLNQKFNLEELANMSPEEKKAETALIVAAGLQNGNHVEAFLPMGDGSISPEPVPIVKTGCNVKEMRKANDSAIMKFLYKIGDYLGITNHAAEQKEIEDTMNARGRIQEQIGRQNNLLEETKKIEKIEKVEEADNLELQEEAEELSAMFG